MDKEATEKLDLDTLRWVMSKMRGLGQDFRFKSMQANDNSVKNTMLTVSGTLFSFANALTKEVQLQEERNALESVSSEAALEEGGHSGEEGEVGQSSEQGA